MYHAISRSDAHTNDPHYTVLQGVFSEHLGRIRELAGGACSARDWLSGADHTSVIMTFDDGLASDHQVALPLLVMNGITADFFVNPATVGQPGYVGWESLKEMVAAGMSVQSHGYDHTYLTSISPKDQRENLYRARVLIEDKLGVEVSLLAPPGGRMPSNLVETARSAGYRHVMCSRPGVLRSIHNNRSPMPRMAVTSGLSARTFEEWVTAQPVAIAVACFRYGALGLAKRVVGDARYERIRKDAMSWLGQ